jgi:hypothetical protein
MSRWTSALNQAAAELDAIRGAWLIDLEFDSGHVRANDSGADLIFGGNTYYGIATFGGFDGIEESENSVASGMRFTLTGVDSAIIATIKTEVYQNRPATLYVGMLAENSNEFVDTPGLAWSGIMDTMTIEKRSREARITLTCEHRLRNSPPKSRWSDADQQARSPTPTPDRFFNLTSLVSSYYSRWGDHATTYGPGPGGGVIPR